MPAKITRRDFLKATSLLAAPATSTATDVPASAPDVPGAATSVPGAATGVPAAATSVQASPQAYSYAYVGTYTPNGGGIYLFRMERSSGALTQLKVFDDIRNPSWLAMNPAQSRLYAVSEIDNYQGTRQGAVVSYAIDSETSELRRLGAWSSAGNTPAHASVHPSGKFLFVANYGGGNVAVLPVGPNGALGEPSESGRAWVRATKRARWTIRRVNSRSATMIARMCTGWRRTPAVSSSSQTMRDSI